MTTASLNYTGRVRIKRKQFDVSHKTNADAEDFEVAVWVDPKILGDVSETDAVILDMVNRADHERFVLKSVESQTVRPQGFSRDTRPRYRIAVVDQKGPAPGKIKMSSPEFKLAAPPDEIAEDKERFSPIKELRESTETFFLPEESDELGALPWKVDFEDVGRVRVLINTRLMDAYDGDQKNPVLRAMMLAPMVREVFVGIFMRIDSIQGIEGCESASWFEWAKFMMEDELPNEPFAGQEGVSPEWLEWLDRLMDEFSSRRFDGEHTLLSRMEVYLND